MAASFPTSIKTWSARTDDVDDVVAADVNTLYEEVTAIENALGEGFVGGVVQVVNYQTGAVASGSTTIPFDDTIPKSNEGNEFMTLAITPTSATNTLVIDVRGYFGLNVNLARMYACLFQDDGIDAIAVMMFANANNASPGGCVSFTHCMTAGTTSETTFKLRVGSDSAGTVTFNGVSGGRLMGGVMASSITITEIKV